MQKTLTIVYSIVTAALAIVMTILQLQPAHALINVFTTYDGRGYYLAPVVLVTWLILLMPMLIILGVMRILRGNKNDEIPAGKTGIVVMRKKAFQSAVVGIPVFVNGEKAGMIDNGRIRFIEVPAGKLTLQAGIGKQASQLIETDITSGQQLQFVVQLIPDGFTLKTILIQG